MTDRVISVITPFYNSRDFMDVPYKSLLNQSYKNWEWICVDDCSTDETLKILEEWASNDSRIKVVKTTVNGGNAAKSINYGIPYCSGSHIQILGHDDELTSDTLESISQRIAETNADVIIPDAEVVNDLVENVKNYKIIGVKKHKEWIDSDEQRNVILTPKEACQYSIGWRLHTWACYSKELWMRCGLDDEDGMNGDEYLTRVFLLNSNKVAFSKGTYRYIRRPTSISNKLSVKFFDVFKTEEKLLKLVRENHFDKNVIKIQVNSLVHKYYSCLIKYKLTYHNFSSDEKKQIESMLMHGKVLLFRYVPVFKIFTSFFDKYLKSLFYYHIWYFLNNRLKRRGII